MRIEQKEEEILVIRNKRRGIKLRKKKALISSNCKGCCLRKPNNYMCLRYGRLLTNICNGEKIIFVGGLMKIIKGKGDKVMILRNKRRGLRLLVRDDTRVDRSGCEIDCYLWNKSLCVGKPCGKVGLWVWGSYHFVRDED